MLLALGNNAPTSEREIVNTFLYPHSPDSVFEAWADPARLTRWWGPNGFTCTFHDFDFRPGGEWRFTMHGPDGTDYKNHSRFIEITRPKRIVIEHLSGPKFQLTASFDKKCGKTKLAFRMLFEDAQVCRQMRDFCTIANGQNLERLSRELDGAK